jgi:thiol:disulfide interchange protein DsbD
MQFVTLPRLTRIAVVLAPLTAVSVFCLGQAQAGDSEQIGTIRLVSRVGAISPGRPFAVATEIKLPAGWHTYWRNPGDAGAATTIAWQLPTGFRADSTEWPWPERIPSGPLVSYGYHGEVWLPVTIHPPASLPSGSSPVKLTADVEWLVCRDICIVQQRQLTLALPVTTGEPPSSAFREGFERAAQKQPRTATWPAKFHADGGDLVLRIAVPKAEAGQPSWFFPITPGAIDYAAPQSFEHGVEGLRLRVRRDTTEPRLPEALSGVLTAERDGRPVAYMIHARQEPSRAHIKE